MKTDGNPLSSPDGVEVANEDDGNPLHLRTALRLLIRRPQPASSPDGVEVANEDDGNPLHLRTALRLLMKTTATRFISGRR